MLYRVFINSLPDSDEKVKVLTFDENSPILDDPMLCYVSKVKITSDYFVEIETSHREYDGISYNDIKTFLKCIDLPYSSPSFHIDCNAVKNGIILMNMQQSPNCYGLTTDERIKNALSPEHIQKFLKDNNIVI